MIAPSRLSISLPENQSRVCRSHIRIGLGRRWKVWVVVVVLRQGEDRWEKALQRGGLKDSFGGGKVFLCDR